MTTEAIGVAASPTGEQSSRSGADLSARAALLVFVVAGIAMVVAVPAVARHLWFSYDEWDFLATRSPGNLNDLFIPHVGHWSTLPILWYQGLLALFGLRTYLPYQLSVDVLHFVVAVLLRVVMRRAGVGPWIATAGAGLYALFGSGYENIAWGFQVAWVAVLSLGLTQLLLADHDGPIERRDWLGLAAGTLGLLCASGLAIVMVVVVGVATLLRRGRRIALFHTVPLALIYGSWWFVVGRHYPSRTVSAGTLTRLPALASWVTNQVRFTFDALGQLPGLGAALGGVLIVGLVLAWRSRDREERRMLSATGALLIGAFFFVGSSAWERATPTGGGYAGASHFLDVVAALVLPGIAVAADALARRWRILLPAILALLLLGIPGNLQMLGRPGLRYRAGLQVAVRNDLLDVAYVPIAGALPRSWPIAIYYPGATLGWLVDQKRAGRLPSPPHLSAQSEASLTLYLALKQSTGSPTGQACRPLLQPVTLRLRKRESLWIRGGELESRYVTRKAVSSPISFDPASGRKLTAFAGPLTVIFASRNASAPAALCGN